MRISKLLGERIKETPAGINIKSHAYLIRAGYIKQVSNGIYTLLPPAQRVNQKLQSIIREEMDAIDGQEVLFPVVMPRELWDKSGRYSSIGQELLRFKDRTGHDMVLGMTHEEAAVHACLSTVRSYDQLPFMIYQIQTKYRDEARPRAGLIRVKEFTMKDAYSFHLTSDDLEEYYEKVYKAYEKIFTRMGMKDFIAVKSDSGMMGGKIAHEFQLLTDIGEDSIVICDECKYTANMEVAKCKLDENDHVFGIKKEVFTGDAKTIDEVCNLLNVDKKHTCKAVCYAVVGNEKDVVIAFVRGDREINEAKLKALVGSDIAVKDLTDSGLVKGNIGCLDLKIENAKIFYDRSLEGLENFVTGANKEKYHILSVSISRDVKPESFVDITKVNDGDKCPICGKTLKVKRGIEIGNIFQLGTKYTKSMGMLINTPNGTINPIMGCYGIGVGRCLASIAEQYSDEKGLVWPMAVAPWHIYLCPIRIDDESVKNTSERIYEKLNAENFEVLYDDRNVSAGIKLKDSELMGIPVRIVVSPKTLENNEVEITIRETGEKFFVPIEKLSRKLDEIVVYWKSPKGDFFNL